MAFVFSLPALTSAETLRVAVASNFFNTMQKLSESFEKSSGHQLLLNSGSTGRHYAQIKNGAPFDVFFSADAIRPKLLEEQLLVKKGSRFTYAVGRLALMSFDGSTENGLPSLTDSVVKRIAIANSRLAPYGAAAEQVFISLGYEEKIKNKLVRGENINQAYQFVTSGNAQLGLVSYAQIIQAEQQSFWLVPSHLHEPIKQQAVIINDSNAAQALFNYMRSEEALELIKAQGYEIP